MDTRENSLQEIGRNAYESIAAMVAALDCDYDRLEELREAFSDWRDLIVENAEVEGRPPVDPATITRDSWAIVNEDAEELAELESAAAAGDVNYPCKDRDEARQKIEEDALSLRIFGERVNGEWTADKFELLLTTGGPAVRIMGEIDEHGEPDRAWLEVQDWGTPWTQYIGADQDTLLSYARCFYMGE